MKRVFLLCLLVFFTFQFYAKDIKLELEYSKYFGTVAKTTINDDNLNIRLKPSTSSLKVGMLKKGDVVTITGYSDKRELIDGFYGYWLKIRIKENDIIKDYAFDNSGWYGWIFSKYVDIDPTVDVSTFRVIKENPETKSTSLSLELEIDRNGQKSIVKVYPEKFSKQESYCFVWSDDIEGFLYSDPVGTFRWNPKTNEITHITDMGFDCESAWCIASDDGKYLFQDFGTSPGIRSFSIYSIETNKCLYRGNYLHDLEYDGKTIIIANKSYDEEYLKTLPPEEAEYAQVIARYKLNLNNFRKEFLDYTVTYMQ